MSLNTAHVQGGGCLIHAGEWWVIKFMIIPWCPLTYYLRITIISADSTTDALGAEFVAAATNCISCRVPLSPLFFPSSGRTRYRYVSPAGGSYLYGIRLRMRNGIRSFELLRVSGLGLRHPLVSGTQLEYTHTFNLDYIQDAQAVVIMPIFTTGPPTLSNILYYHALYIYFFYHVPTFCIYVLLPCTLIAIRTNIP